MGEEFDHEAFHLSVGDDRDNRKVALLTDFTRRDFLANVNPRVGNAYSTLYHWYNDWLDYCERMEARTNDKRWRIAARRWQARIVWLDRQLIYTGAKSGKRAEQIVQALASERESKRGESVHLVASPEEKDDSGKRKGGFFR